MINKGVVVVLYYTRGVYPLRTTISDHLYCFKKFGSYPIVYVNVAFGFPWKLLSDLPIRAVIFHTIFLSMRWSLQIFEQRTKEVMALKSLDCVKIAIPQDEFIHTDQLSQFLKDINISHIFSCAPSSEWEKIYIHQNLDQVKFKQILTGYLSDTTIDAVEKLKRKAKKRSIDIGYRAWKAAYWLGKHGRLKVEFAERILQLSPQNYNIDVSLRDGDVLNGLDWFKFLLNCRSVIGVEGGSSILDSTGTIKTQVDLYLNSYPNAQFEQVWGDLLKNHEDSLNLKAISPRHLEACLTETCQILVEGEYNGILKPGKHYISVKKDYSNLGEVLQNIQDDRLIKEITSSAYKDIVLSKKYSYQAFVKIIEESYLDSKSKKYKLGFAGGFSYLILKLRDRLHWLFISLECKEDLRKNILLKRLHNNLARFLKI